MRQKIRTLTSLIGLLGLSACQQTAYHSYNGLAASQKPSEERLVRYHVAKAYYRSPPDCVVVLPVRGKAKLADKILIERAAVRYLAGKISRVIGPDQRRVLTRRLGLDLELKIDQKYFSTLLLDGHRCRYLAIPSIHGITESFALVWANRQVHLGLEIRSAATGESVWQSDHATGRGDGGLPLSPFSFGSAAFRAGRLSGDTDMLPSMIDDVFRRILKTLPDTRNY